MTRSELEERFLAICDQARLPRPHVNYVIVLEDGGPHVEADFAWPELKVIAEADGWATHGTRQAFTRDRRRDRRLSLAGWVPHHFTWDEVEHDPRYVGVELGALLAREAPMLRIASST